MNMTTTQTKQEAAQEVVRRLGGPVKTAAVLGAPSYQTVQSWTKNGIPAEYCPEAEALSGISCEEMCPGVNWALVRGTRKTAEA